MTRIDRKAAYSRLNISTGQELATFAPNGATAGTVAILPALGSGFPDLNFPIKSVSPIETRFPISEGWRGWVEYNGQTFAAVALHLHSVEFFPGNGGPAIALAFDQSGKEIARIEVSHNEAAAHFAALRLKLAFQKSGEALAVNCFKTTCSEIDPEELTQNWQAVFTPPKGLEKHSVGGDAKILRRNKIDPAKYQHWKGGKIFYSSPLPGKEMAHAVIELSTGGFTCFSWDASTGAILNASNAHTPDLAVCTFAAIESQIR